MKFLNYSQITPLSLWTINHGFGQKVIADVFISFNGVMTKIIPKKVVSVDDNTLTIEFTNPQSGAARLTSSAYGY